MKDIGEGILGLFIGLFLVIMLHFFYGGSHRLIVSTLLILVSISISYLIGLQKETPISNKTFLIWIAALFLILIISAAIMLLNYP